MNRIYVKTNQSPGWACAFLKLTKVKEQLLTYKMWAVGHHISQTTPQPADRYHVQIDSSICCIYVRNCMIKRKNLREMRSPTWMHPYAYIFFFMKENVKKPIFWSTSRVVDIAEWNWLNWVDLQSYKALNTLKVVTWLL